MVGAGDPDSRRMMRFENLLANEERIYDSFRKLGELRSENMPLLYGTINIVSTSEKQIIIARSYLGQTCMLLINKDIEPFEFNIPVGAENFEILVKK